ncbi:MAG: hypothetical protein ACKO2P_18725 [Planctomycetota bacterium]
MKTLETGEFRKPMGMEKPFPGETFFRSGSADLGTADLDEFSKNHEFPFTLRPKNGESAKTGCLPVGFSGESREILRRGKSATLQSHRTSFILRGSFPAVTPIKGLTLPDAVSFRPAQQVRQL